MQLIAPPLHETAGVQALHQLSDAVGALGDVHGKELGRGHDGARQLRPAVERARLELHRKDAEVGIVLHQVGCKDAADKAEALSIDDEGEVLARVLGLCFEKPVATALFDG